MSSSSKQQTAAPNVDARILDDLFSVLKARKQADPSSSYVAKLYHKGVDAILAKVAEESDEVVDAVKNSDDHEVVHEVADLLFHTWVAMAHRDVEPHQIYGELARRFGHSGLDRDKMDKALESFGGRRQHERRAHVKSITLTMRDGQVIEGNTRDVSLEGLQLQTSYEPKDNLLGERGVFEMIVEEQLRSADTESERPLGLEIPSAADDQLHVAETVTINRSYRFTCEIMRVADDSLGLAIVEDSGVFGYALANEVFKDLF
ncbi:phosphoribosyl-ATP diphosphatase [Magnetofaba australis]|uniref:Phosphoribosyl-ATP pyrophosphatase n=1 Tax=Magnetofaba australis IT-1 TaxID=1434232 RepID=A0A1Y2K203_9PROT|nr:phosphoribosyl-ATP diphosphatase [Magnetofaba australis]OSM02033.1 putative phosphoribosyl-ATP pyrophosphatase [Magnetofaba australis IT-1]